MDAATVSINERTHAQDVRRGAGFYQWMASALLVVIIAAFAPRYHILPSADGRVLSPLVHLHAAVSTLWLLLFVAQAWLVARGRVDVHRRMGIGAAVLSVVLVVVGLAVAIAAARRGWNPLPRLPDAIAFFVVPFVDIALFAGFVGAALSQRGNRERHRRLMLLAVTGGLLWPAIVRLPMVAGRFPLMLALLAAFVFASPIRDRIAGRRVHAVDVWGGVVVLASIPLRLAVAMTPAWRDFARWLIG